MTSLAWDRQHRASPTGVSPAHRRPRTFSMGVHAILLATAVVAFFSVATASPTFEIIDLSSHSGFSLLEAKSTDLFTGAGTTNDGRVVFAPMNADHVGVFDPKLIGGPIEDAFKLYDTQLTMDKKFYSAISVGDGRVVFPAFNAGGIGVFDGRDNTFTMKGQGTITATDALIGGGVASDNKVVMCPYRDSHVATLSLDTYVVARIAAPGYVTNAWHGGSATLDGRVVCAPFGVGAVLVYSAGTLDSISASGLPYVGSTMLSDGRVFMAPWTSTAVGIFNPSTNSFNTDTTILPSPDDNSDFSGIVETPDGRVLFQESLSGGNTILVNFTDRTTVSINTRHPDRSGARSWWGAASVGSHVVFAPRFVTDIGVLKFPCGENNHVVSGVCVPCPTGQFNEAGDVQGGPDTACDAECTCARLLNKVGLSYA